MNKNKCLYEAPVVQILVVQIGNVLLESPGGYRSGGGGVYGTNDTIDNGDDY